MRMPTAAASGVATWSRTGPLPRRLVLLRALLPFLVLAGLLAMRDTVVDGLETVFGLGFVIRMTFVYSTLLERATVALPLWIVLFGIAWVVLGRRTERDARRGGALLLLLSALVTLPACLVLAQGSPAALIEGSAAALLLWANARPDRPEDRAGQRLSWPFLGIGAAELLTPRPYLVWLARQAGRRGTALAAALGGRLPRAAAGAAVAAGLCVLQAPFPTLAQLGQTLFRSPQAVPVYGLDFSFFSKYDVSNLVFDPPTGRLLLCGNGLDEVGILEPGPDGLRERVSGIPSGGSQFCMIDPAARRFLVVGNRDDHFRAVDLDSLAVVADRPMPPFPPGEIFTAYNAPAGVIVTASEAVFRSRDMRPVRVLDAQSLAIIGDLGVSPGFLTTHPGKPILYVNYFWRETGIEAFRLPGGERIAGNDRVARSDRTTVDVTRDALFVTSPVHSEVVELDAETLAIRRTIPTVFGVRGLAIDAVRDLLIVTSIMSNEAAVIDLATGRELRRYRLGPWLRDVALDTAQGIAYISSRYGIYRLKYLD